MDSADDIPILPDMSLSVLLPMRNEEKFAESKINSVIGEIINNEKTRLVVVNSSSDDNTREIALNTLSSSILPTSRWDVIDSNIPGKTRAVNLGLSIIEDDLVMMMDTDAKSSPGWLRICQEIFSNPRIGLVCGVEKSETNHPRRSSESVYKKFSNNRRISQSVNSSIVVVEGSMCCFRKEALGGVLLNENYNADDAQLAILCSRNNFLSILDRRLTFQDSNELSRIGNFRRRVRRGRGLSRNLVANIGMSLPRNNPVNPSIFARTVVFYLLLPWISSFVILGAILFLIFPEVVPSFATSGNLKIGLISSFFAFILWPTGRSFLEGCTIMIVAQISSLAHSSKDAWEPDRQRE
mgnify:CR=1 FL=1